MVRTHVIMMDTYCSDQPNSQQRLRTIVFSAHGSSGTAGAAVMDRLFRLSEGGRLFQLSGGPLDPCALKTMVLSRCWELTGPLQYGPIIITCVRTI